MFRQSKKASSLRFSDLLRGDLRGAKVQFKKKYRKMKRKYYLFIFLPAVLLAVGYRAAEEYAGLKRLQARKLGAKAASGKVQEKAETFTPETISPQPLSEKCQKE